MRKIILSAISVFLCIFSINVQIKKGSIFLGGDIGGYTQKTKWDNGSDFESSGLNISPVFGKFIKDNFVVGGSLSFLVNKAEYDAGIKNKSEGYGAGVFIRKYKSIGNRGFYVFIQGGLNGGSTKQKTDDPLVVNDDEIKRTTIGINANPGISFAVSKKISSGDRIQ